jgi:hypothetical protein
LKDDCEFLGRPLLGVRPDRWSPVETMEDVMVDPLTLGLAGAAVGAGLRLADATAEWLTLRGRAGLVRAVVQLPAGTQIAGVRRDGTRWTVRVPPVAGEVPQ